MSDIIIGLTLVFKWDNIHKKSKPNRIEIELLIEKSNRNRLKSIKPNRNITSTNSHVKSTNISPFKETVVFTVPAP